MFLLVAMCSLWTITLDCCMFCWLSFKGIQVVWVCEIVCFHVRNILASSSCILYFVCTYAAEVSEDCQAASVY